MLTVTHSVVDLYRLDQIRTRQTVHLGFQSPVSQSEAVTDGPFDVSSSTFFRPIRRFASIVCAQSIRSVYLLQKVLHQRSEVAVSPAGGRGGLVLSHINRMPVLARPMGVSTPQVLCATHVSVAVSACYASRLFCTLLGICYCSCSTC